MHRITYDKGQVIGSQKSEGSEMVIKDGEGKEIERRPLTEEEVAQVQAEGQPTADETLVADLQVADTNAKTTAALIKRFEK